MRVERVQSVLAAIKKAKLKYGPKTNSVVVGYTANYALHVHEMIEKDGSPRKGIGTPRRKPHKGMYWDPQGKGQSKFLEQPFIEHREELARVVIDTTRATKNLEQGLLVAGLRLQRMSQELVPIDTGNLRASAFTSREQTAGEAVAISKLETGKRLQAQAAKRGKKK